MKRDPSIVLASQSPRRRQLLEALGLSFDVMASDIDEIRNPGESPSDFALRAALEKGKEVCTRLQAKGDTPWIISADTIVVLGDEVFFKPEDDDDARRMLERLSGNTHLVMTGWTVGHAAGEWRSALTQTGVTFHPLDNGQIDGYVATGEGADKAGAYAIQGIGTFLVDRIDGNYFNVVGLPVSLVVRALLEVGAIERFPL